jgi:hypothetical protein
MEIPREAVETGLSQAELHRRWESFAGDKPTYVAWHTSSLDFAQTLAPPDHRICLKTAYCNSNKGKSGHLEDIVVQLALALPALDTTTGRARRRLEAAVGLAEYFRSSLMGNSARQLPTH